jgi:hypothetical protein
MRPFIAKLLLFLPVNISYSVLLLLLLGIWNMYCYYSGVDIFIGCRVELSWYRVLNIALWVSVSVLFTCRLFLLIRQIWYLSSPFRFFPFFSVLITSTVSSHMWVLSFVYHWAARTCYYYHVLLQYIICIRCWMSVPFVYYISVAGPGLLICIREFYYIGWFKKSFTNLKEYTNLCKGHTQRFEIVIM